MTPVQRNTLDSAGLTAAYVETLRRRFPNERVNLYRRFPPRMPTGKFVGDEQLLALWRSKLDTYEIAIQVGIPEAEVANRLPGIRERDRRDTEWGEP